MTSINILGSTYRIRFEPDLVRDRGRQAEINYIKQEIVIDADTSRTDRAFVSLLHETLHAIFEGLDFEEENENEHLIQSLATSIYQVLISNKQLIDEILCIQAAAERIKAEALQGCCILGDN